MKHERRPVGRRRDHRSSGAFVIRFEAIELTQYHHLDDSGDPGLSGAAGSSTHFALAMVQLSDRLPLPELGAVRSAFHLPMFEFKYHLRRRIKRPRLSS